MSWIRVQGSLKCASCGGVTPANAAVDGFECVRCGARIEVRPALWDEALEDAVERSDGLADNASVPLELDVGTAALTLVISATAARCPDCDGAWDTVPDGRCPHCENPISVRGRGGATLVAEDPSSLAGERRDAEAVTISCVSCGAPLTAEGDRRELVCGNCSRTNVVPDHVWRRLNAPEKVATWYLHGASGTGADGITRALDGVMALAVHDGVVFMVARYECQPCLAAVRGRRFQWMVPLTDDEIDIFARPSLFVVDGALHAVGMGRNTMRSFDAATGARRPPTTLPAGAMAATSDADGSVLLRTLQGPVRLAGGQNVPVFPPLGCLWAWRGHSGSRLLSDGSGGLTLGLDGDVRVSNGSQVSRIKRDGTVAWTATLPGGTGSVVPPAAAPDGTTFAVVRTVGGSMTVEQIQAQMASGFAQDSSSTLFRIGADGSGVRELVRSGAEEFHALAVTADEVWVADLEGVLYVYDHDGALVWKHVGGST